MYHVVLHSDGTDEFESCVLIKKQALNQSELQNHYLDQHEKIIAFSAEYNEKGNAPVGFIKDYLDKLLPILKRMGVTTIYCADSAYFKVLAGQKKVEPHYGYYYPCNIPGYANMKIVCGVNYQSLFFNPNNESKLELSMTAFNAAINGFPVDIGQGIIKSSKFLTDRNMGTYRRELEKLKEHPVLTVDIETFSLKHQNAGIATIAFAWNKHEGVAFRIDYLRVHSHDRFVSTDLYGVLRDFFESYEGTLIFQGGTFDIKVLVYYLYMKQRGDTAGMLKGIDTFTRALHDTHLIGYLATNNTAGNSLSLKDMAHEFTGNYALDDIKDITQVPLDELLEYNLIDALATFYVFEKHYPVLKFDKQLDVYEKIFKKSMPVIIQMELTGMPLDRDRVTSVQKELENIRDDLLFKIENHPIAKEYLGKRRFQEYLIKNAEWKRKKEPLEYFNYVEFNPNSNTQLQELIYKHMDLPVLDLTKAKQPSTKADTLKKLIENYASQEQAELLQSIKDLSEVSIILNTFISAFMEQSFPKEDGHFYLHGNFNLGGTVSGRLSSSKPNLQNIPSTGTKFAKIVKSCFVPPKGWLLCGADFASLEDRISALTTKDPNKLRVYTDGYDGHMLRAYYYFSDQMQDVAQIDDLATGYEIKQPDGTTFYIKEDTMIICPNGEQKTIKAYYESIRVT